MHKLIQPLYEPFPDRSSGKGSFFNLVGVGVFVSLFLYLIRPFGIGGLRDDLIFGCIGFGVITVLFGWIYDIVNRYVLQIKTDTPSWTLGKWIIQTTGLILWIAFGNYLFMNFLNGWHWTEIQFFFQMMGNTLLVGIFPVVFSGLVIQLKAAKDYQKQASEIHPHSTKTQAQNESIIRFSVTPGKDLPIHLADMRYIEAMQNYVSISYVANGELKKELIRGTIAGVEELVAETSMIRCHRSFIVNINAVKKVAGNAQGLKLSLSDVADMEVPVSRTHIPRLKELFSQE